MMKTLLTATFAVITLAACGGPGMDAAAPSGMSTLKQAAKSSGSTSTTTSTTSTTTTRTRTKVAAPVAVSYAAKTTDAQVAGAPVWKDAFPIASTYDVFMATEITGALSGHHTAIFEVRMPDGTVYARYDVGFATDVPAGMGEQQAQATSTGYRVWATLPVAGTMIQQANLAGTWRLDVFIDGAATPNVSHSFGLQ